MLRRRLNLPGRVAVTPRLSRRFPRGSPVSVHMETPGLLVLADLWDNGWRAYRNESLPRPPGCIRPCEETSIVRIELTVWSRKASPRSSPCHWPVAFAVSSEPRRTDTAGDSTR